MLSHASLQLPLLREAEDENVAHKREIAAHKREIALLTRRGAELERELVQKEREQEALLEREQEVMHALELERASTLSLSRANDQLQSELRATALRLEAATSQVERQESAESTLGQALLESGEQYERLKAHLKQRDDSLEYESARSKALEEAAAALSSRLRLVETSGESR